MSLVARCALGAIAGIAWVAAVAAGPPLYQVTDLGTLGGGTSAALDINEQGGVAGWAATEGGQQLGFRRDPGQPMFQLTLYGLEGQATALSDYPEEACGWGLNPSGTRRALYFIFDLIVEIGAPTGEPSQANDVNDLGVTVGWLDEVGFPRRAFVYGGGVKVFFLPALTGGDSEATAINQAGVIAGVSLNADGESEAVRWTPGGVESLGTLGGASSRATGINAHDQIVGVSDLATPAAMAFLWLPQAAYGLPEGMNNLGTLDGYTDSIANDINDAGRVVGQALGDDSQSPQAFVWDAAFGMHDLNTRIPRDEGWELLAATAINNTGRIVGYGLHHGVLRAYRLTPLPLGDFTGDGCVDQADLGVLLAAFGVSAVGDLNDDGVTDQADLGILLANFGACL